jgi:hypothetical protein
MSKLIEGFIPAKTKCPFRSECQLVAVCKHMGVHHTIQYSCAYARVLDRKSEGMFTPTPIPVPKPKQDDLSNFVWLDTPNKRVRP